MSDFEAIEQQIAWIDRWPCVDPGCIDGGIPHNVGPDDWEQQQCQFCYEKGEIRDTMTRLLAVARAADLANTGTLAGWMQLEQALTDLKGGGNDE
jgi:hypothetical protein